MKKLPLRSKLVHQYEKPSFTIEVWQTGKVLLNFETDYFIFDSLESCNEFIKNNYE